MKVESEARGRAAPRLLIVDDDRDFCTILSRATAKRGFDVATARNIGAALELARSCLPDFALVDLRIGDESGLDLVRDLAALEPRPRIVVLTGYASIATAVEAIKLGAIHYLTKPAEVDDIIAAFDRVQGDPEISPAETPMSVKRLEWEHLQKVLREHKGNISATARALNMHRRTLQRKLQKYPVKR
ncbi:MAG: response regulator transcription factor [Pseudomonadota bacterium]|nr:response regulator transcription factor [Pseudomonadota bacterium]